MFPRAVDSCIFTAIMRVVVIFLAGMAVGLVLGFLAGKSAGPPRRPPIDFS